MALGLGVLAVVAATVAGADGAAPRRTRPSAGDRPGRRSSAVSATLAVVCLARGLARLAAGTEDVPGLVRGVRWIFLAVAAVAAGAGWVTGNALPLIVALVIAGIDVIETSFLLLVVGHGTADPRS